MQKVWHRTQTGWFYASIKKGGRYQQVKLVQAPNDRDGKKLAEAQLIQELAAKLNDYDAVADGSARWLTVAHVLNGFLAHSQSEHEPATVRWHRDLITPFRDMLGKLRVPQTPEKTRQGLAQGQEVQPDVR